MRGKIRFEKENMSVVCQGNDKISQVVNNVKFKKLLQGTHRQYHNYARLHELYGNGQMDMLAWICRYNIPEEEMRMRIA